MAASAMKPKVFYDHGQRILVGPLGFWRAGDSLSHDGREFFVGSVDWDGMAICYSGEYLDGLGAREPKRGPSRAEVLASLANVRTGYPVNERQKEQCRRIAAVGERLREAV